MTTLRAIRSTQEVDITIGMFHGKDITLRRTPLAATLREIKLKIENISGIPVHCQRITYLDECDMYDNRNLEWYDVVDKASLNLRIWSPFEDLVVAAISGNITNVFKSGILDKQGFIKETEGIVALYLAAHYGYLKLTLILLSYGVKVNTTNTIGRTALHAAGGTGQWSVLCLLINWGADIHRKDIYGNTAMDYARINGHKQSARGLALYQWHLNKEEKSKSKESVVVDISLQFPIHWLTEIKGVSNKQVFQPPVTMNLVAAQAANMLQIMSDSPSDQDRDRNRRAPSPSYGCGKDHLIPGVTALNVRNKTITSLPPISDVAARPRSQPPCYEDWLKEKNKVYMERIKLLKEAEREANTRKALESQKKQLQAEQAFASWMQSKTRIGGSIRKTVNV